MSVLKSYFSKNNTIIYNSHVNTGRNPITQLYFGGDLATYAPRGFTRFLFDLDLSYLQEQIATGVISTGCTPSMTHILNMTNTSSFDIELLNGTTSNGSRRATSFDLILFRIPEYSGTTGIPQQWDEGVGFDYVYQPAVAEYSNNQPYSTRPSNWFQGTTLNDWSYPGLYNNTNTIVGGFSGLNYSALTIVDRQHFEFGNEDISFDMSNEINNIIDGTLTGVTGWGIAYVPQIENITGLTETYSVGFFTRHTQTFYQPYLQTTYDDIIKDDRNIFLKNQENKLYLYVYQNGDLSNLDTLPFARIEDRAGTAVTGMESLNTCLRTKGVYEVIVPNGFTNSPTPCQYFDTWSGLTINGQSIPNVTNQFILQQYSAGIQIGSQSKDPSIYGFDFYGILQNEQILNTDIRKEIGRAHV